MSPSLHRLKGKSSEPILLRKPSVEQPLLQELIPETALPLASTLSNDDKEVLVFLVLFGRNALLTSEASISAARSPWKPWKSSSSKAGMRQQVCPSCPFLDSLSSSVLLTEEGLSKRIPWPYAKYKAGFSCDCFSCYSSFWSRWSASPDRDTINDILDEIESIPQGSKGKKRKKLDKKRAIVNKNVEKDDIESSLTSRDSGLNDVESSLASRDSVVNDVRSMDTSMISLVNDGSHAGIAMENGPIVVKKNTTGRKKSLFRGMKQKEKPCVTSPDRAPRAEVLQNAGSMVSSMLDESESPTEAVAIEIPEILTIDISPSVALGVSSAVKNKQHLRLGKRRSNQVLPLNCEDVVAVEGEQDSVIVMENTHFPVSPRTADVALGGRGFLARVFPDALGRVASRLWDLVSVRLRSRSVEYH